jgi:hypothetical protein
MPLYDPVRVAKLCLLWMGCLVQSLAGSTPHVVSSMFLVSGDNVKTLVMECILFIDRSFSYSYNLIITDKLLQIHYGGVM